MGCRQCDMITTPKRQPIVFDRKESYGRYTSQSYLNHRLPHCRVLLSAGKAPDHPRAILHQIRRSDCGTAKGILYSHSPAINSRKRPHLAVRASDCRQIWQRVWITCCHICLQSVPPLRWGMNGGSQNLRKQLMANKWHICYNKTVEVIQ